MRLDTTLRAFTAVVTLSFIGCLGGGGNAAVPGCTDPSAQNYDPMATVDDGSCVPFQGPRNPDFEATTGDWVSDSGNNYAGNGPATIVTGTAFMPTHGIQYLSMATSTSNNWYTGSSIIYQDGVDFSHSSTLTFDYEFSGSAGNGMSVTVEILFTVNGTATLWSKTFAGSWAGMFPATFDDQVLNETVTLPSLPDPGRLTINLTTVGGQNASGAFAIDNIRVN